MDCWYFSTFGSEFGPFTFDELVELAKSRQLSATDLVKLGIEGKWRNAGSIGRLVAHLPFEQKENTNLDVTATVSSAEPSSKSTRSQRVDQREHSLQEVSALNRPGQPHLSPSATSQRSDTRLVLREKPSQWWCRVDGVEYGPVEIEILQDWVRKGQLHPTDELRSSTDGEYVVAGTYREIFTTSPPAAPNKKSPPRRTAGHARVTESTPKRDLKSEATKEQTTARTKSDLAVAPSEATNTVEVLHDHDEMAREKILRRIADAKVSSFSGLEIEVRQRIVTVRGTLASEGERLLLQRLLQKTIGGLAINDEIKVFSAIKPIPSAITRTSAVSAKSVASVPKITPFRFSRVFSSFTMMHAFIAAASILIMASAVIVVQASSSNGKVAVYPTKGSVTLDGKPMPKAIVVLNPTKSANDGTKGPYIRGIADSEGGFEISTYGNKDGAPVGDYVATVTWSKPETSGNGAPIPSNACPTLYLKPETSPLKVTIKKGSNDLGQIELHSSETK